MPRTLQRRSGAAFASWRCYTQSVAEFYKGKTRVIVCASVALAQTATCAAPTAAWHG